MDKVAHVAAELQNAILSEEFDGFGKEKCPYETRQERSTNCGASKLYFLMGEQKNGSTYSGRKAIKQHKTDNNRRCYQVCSLATEYGHGAAMSTENFLNFEKCKSLPARNRRKKQDIGPLPHTLHSPERCIMSGFSQVRMFPHSVLQSITNQDSSQNVEWETKNQTQLKSLHTPSEGDGIQQPTLFGQPDNHEEWGQYYEYLSVKVNERQPWKETILSYWTDDEDEVRPQLGSQFFEVELLARQAKAKKGKGLAKGKRTSLKEQRRMKSNLKKQQWARYSQARAMVKNSCYFDVKSREEFRSQREQPHCFDPEMKLLPYYYSSPFPQAVLYDQPSANVCPLPSIGQIFDNLYSRTSLITTNHRDKVIERARKVYHQRCLNRKQTNSGGHEDETSADKMDPRRDNEKPDHSVEESKQKKGDEFKITEFDLWTLDISEEKNKITKRKKTGKVSKEKRKEKRRANKASAKVPLGIDGLEETEVVIDNSNFLNKSPEEKCQESTDQDEREGQTKGKHENFNSSDRNGVESKMGNITIELVKAIGDRHCEEISSENFQQENVEKRDVKHKKVNQFPSETFSVVSKSFNSATVSKEQGHTNQGVLEYVTGKTSQESYLQETGPTYPVGSVPHASYNRRPNGGVGLPRGRVSASDRGARSANRETIQRSRQNKASWRWRENSAAAGDWACHNKAEMRGAEHQRTKRKSRDRGDSDQNECRPYEGGIVFHSHTDHRVTVHESRFNGRLERQRNRQHRKSCKERSRGNLLSSSLSSNWRSKKDEINEDLQRKGSWEANNAVCESDRLCDPAVLVSPHKPEPHIRNRRLSPGSGIGGGGGGGCSAGPDQQLGQPSPLAPEGTLNGTGHPFAFAHSRERERRGYARGRGPRRENLRASGRPGDKAQRPVPKARWVDDSLSLLKPPPAFPVKDSPAKLQPAVSYASKVKAGGGASGGTEEPPGIGVLLQNQWGLSFISDGPAENSPSTAALVLDPAQTQPSQATPETATSHPGPTSHPLTGDMDSEKPALTPTPAPATPSFSMELCNRQDESSGELLLTCRHLVEAMQYHVHEWNTVYNRQKDDPAKVVWYKNSLEQPA